MAALATVTIRLMEKKITRDMDRLGKLLIILTAASCLIAVTALIVALTSSGPDGKQGEQGATGPAGKQGERGETGPAGKQMAGGGGLVSELHKTTFEDIEIGNTKEVTLKVKDNTVPTGWKKVDGDGIQCGKAGLYSLALQCTLKTRENPTALIYIELGSAESETEPVTLQSSRHRELSGENSMSVSTWVHLEVSSVLYFKVYADLDQTVFSDVKLDTVLLT